MTTLTKPYRLYPRQDGARVERWYVDLRRLGGGREALVPPGETLATVDPDVAAALAEDKYQAIRKQRIERDDRKKLGLTLPTSLHEYARYHLIQKREAGGETQWLSAVEKHLARAVEHFGKDRDLTAIGVADVSSWCAALRRQGLHDPTIRQHLNSLSNLYRRASAESRVPANYNPVRGMMPGEKPSARPLTKAQWLEVPDAALYLEAARLYKPTRDDIGMPFAYELVATALLTGGRPSEVLGLELADVDFKRQLVRFRPNAWRTLKTRKSERAVPLHPQLVTILKRYLGGRHAPKGRLLFPSYRTGKEAMLTDVRKLLDGIGTLLGRAPRTTGGKRDSEMNLYLCRHTYATARRQTLDRGVPISDVTVAHELGHNSAKMIEETYGHLGTVRHRAKHVEYRVSQWRKELAPRLKALRALAKAEETRRLAHTMKRVRA